MNYGVAETDKKLVLSDEDFLAICAEQKRQAIGFDNANGDTGELSGAREQALNYIKGEMADVPSYPNRSRAVSSDVSDAIETALPDLIEIFIGGDDVATFEAQGPDDEDQAKLETECVTKTVFDHNAGFLLLYTMIKDALTCKLGVAKSWWEDGEEIDETEQTGIPPDAMPFIYEKAARDGAEITDEEMAEDGSVSFTVLTKRNTGCQKNMAVPPEDFAFARDTVLLRDTAYCAMRSRPRAQSLVDQGYDANDIDDLPDYSSQDDTTDLARDTAGESSERVTSSSNRGLRPVEIVEHYVRVDADGDGKTELWCVVTGGGETVFLRKHKVPSIPFSAITPYITPHRLMGRSLADLLLEIQRIKTALLRMLLDSGYFALNQRMEVASTGSNEWTLSDLMRNEPNMPVRSTSGTAVRAISAGGLGFDVTGALEYINTVAEGRTGIVRNAQGLNPDTLHDTADGARQLIGAAQKRLRLIARVFAETGIKDLFLNVHEQLRLHGREIDMHLGGAWAKVDPTTWPERKGLKVEIGVGSGGREHDIMAGNALNAMLAQAVQGQGGALNGELTNASGLRAALRRQTERLGYKRAEQYFPDPPPPSQEPQQPAPDPKLVEVQQKGQLATLQAQQAHELAVKKAESDAQLAQAEAMGRHEREVENAAKAHDLKERQVQAELDLKREQLQAELVLKRDQMVTDAQMRYAGAAIHAHTSASIGSEVHPGGEPG